MKQHLGLAAKKCVPCKEGKAKALSDIEVNSYRNQTPGWQIITNAQGHRCLRQQWKVKNFQAGLEVFGRIGRIAEEEGHHPDLHLEGFNTVAADLSTHSVGEWVAFPDYVCTDCICIDCHELLAARDFAIPLLAFCWTACFPLAIMHYTRYVMICIHSLCCMLTYIVKGLQHSK